MSRMQVVPYVLVLAVASSVPLASPGNSSSATGLHLHKTPVSPIKEDRLLLFTLIFGSCQMQSLPHVRFPGGRFGVLMFRLFLKSISGSGADLIVLTDVEQMPDIIQMPSNVRIRHIRWREFVFKLEARFNHGNAFASLRDPSTFGGKHGGACYRVSDFKPVLEELFHVPEKYSWWGWLDNDVLVGSHCCLPDLGGMGRSILQTLRYVNYIIISFAL